LNRIRILGIDPGSRVTGFGVIDSDGVRSTLVESGCIRLDDGDFAARLGRIYAGLSAVLERLDKQGIEPQDLSNADFAKLLAADYVRMAQVVKASGAKLE